MSDPTDVFMWRRLDDHVTTSGQPSEAQLAVIAALGVSDVVNLGLHSHEKALPDEAASVATLGMTYHHIPVAFDDPKAEDYAMFDALMRSLADRTIHVHCIANLRVSAFFFRYRREHLGLSEIEARAELECIWKPGAVWAEFVGDGTSAPLSHRYAGRDY